VVVTRRGDAGPGGVDFAEVVGRGAAELPAAEIGPNDLATILYTSGTTGDPKGVVLTHANVVYECEATLRRNGVQHGNITLSYLPYAHIAERQIGRRNPPWSLQPGWQAPPRRQDHS